MIYYKPKNLDLDKIICEQPPYIRQFSKEKLLYIIHLISMIPANNKDLEINNGFVPIHSQKIRLVIPNYKQYFNYLIEAKVLETDNQYIKGKKSKGYRFNETYRTDLKPVEVENLFDKKNVANNKRSMSMLSRSHSYLTKWFNEKLHINYDLAMDFIHVDKQRRLDDLSLLADEKKIQDECFKIHRQFTSSHINIERIFKQEFILSLGPKSNRFYSNLSYLRSTLRNCLSYDGKPFVAIDIKNSQPYLSALLTKKTFWDAASSTGLHINSFKKLAFDTNAPIEKIISFLSNKGNNIDLVKYVRSVTSGQFYEEFEKLAGERINRTFSNRKEIKETIFQTMFTDNKYLADEKAAPKRLFKELFPSVYHLFALVKEHEKERLPILLQRIESKIVIETVAKRIGKEKPNLPIFTIHDSIVTTKGNECYIKMLLEEELFKGTGYMPTLNMHLWSSDNLFKQENEPELQEVLRELCA